MSNGIDTSVCVYATRNGLFYNAKDEREPVKLIDGRVDGLFRQFDHLYAVSTGPVLYELTLTTKTKEVSAHEVFRNKRQKDVFGFFNSFVGGHYDAKKGRLILGASNAMIYVFERSVRLGKLDMRFNDRMTKFWSNEMRAYTEKIEGQPKKVEQGNVMYFDEDTQCCVYIGIKYVMKVSVEAEPKVFAVIKDLKHWLKGITFDCAHFLYIYHQKTLVVMKRVHASAQCPFQMRVYTGNKLR